MRVLRLTAYDDDARCRAWELVPARIYICDEPVYFENFYPSKQLFNGVNENRLSSHDVGVRSFYEAIFNPGSTAMSDRIKSFVEAMQVQPGDRGLEIGCGHGLAATLVCGSLNGGMETFDKVLAMRVRLFVEQPDKAHALARRWLAPGGRLFVEYNEPARTSRPARRAFA